MKRKRNYEKYDVIYSDPPWKYDFSKSKSRKIENQYETMTLEDIKNLNVPSADDSILYLWATAPKLLEALSVMDAWGFEYITQMVWDKEIMGMGYWFRGQHEILLVGRKGKFSPPPASLRISSVYREKRSSHSKKPDAIRNLISSWFPDAKKIELFSRDNTEGWDVWGNEVESDMDLL
jgi:N6-adenosine-specific RNA methylase IME4